MRSLWQALAVIVLLFTFFAPVADASPRRATEEPYVVVVKNEQRLYVAEGDPKSPTSADVIKDFPVSTGAIWLQKGLETPNGFYTVVEKSNSPVQGGYSYAGNGDVVITPYFMRLNVPNRGGIGIHTYEGRTLDIGRFGYPGGETTHGCISGPPGPIVDLYENYVEPGRTRVWVVDEAAEAFKDLKPTPKPTVTEVNGMTWQEVKSPTEQQFYAVQMLSPDLGWAISGDALVKNGEYTWESIVYKWDGEEWSKEATIPNWMHSLHMLNENEGWAVGANQIGGYHYKNGKWTEVDRTIPTWPYLSDVAVLDEDTAWAVGGNGEFFKLDAQENIWANFLAPGIVKTLRSISMLDENYGWTVGGGWDTTSPEKENMPVLAYFDGEEWVPAESPVEKNMYGVKTLARDDAWAVGMDGAIIHYNGEEWESVDSPATQRLSDLDFSSPNDGWAVGDERGVAFHWDGQKWTAVKLPVDTKFYDVSMLSDGSAVAVGSGGSIIRLSEAAAPEPTATPEPPTPTPEPEEPQPTPEAKTQPDEPYATAEVDAPYTDDVVVPTIAAVQEGSNGQVAQADTGSPVEAQEADNNTQANVETSMNEQPASDVAAPAEQPQEQAGGVPVAPVAAGLGGLGVLAAAFALFRRRA